MRYFLYITILLLTFVFSNCSSPPAVNNTTANGSPNSNQNTAKTPSNSGMPTPIPSAQTSTTNNAPTFTPVVQGYYDALQKKDEAGVKKYLSVAALKYWETEGKTAKKTWLDYILEDEDPVAEKREVRNEKIEGDSATVEIKGGSLGVWTKKGFIKENGEWKFDSPEKIFKNLQDIRKNASNASNPNS